MCKIFCTQLLDKAPCILYLHSLIPNTVLQIKMYIYVPVTMNHIASKSKCTNGLLPLNHLYSFEHAFL